jgi:alpha-methylacyl-CoA racemase
MMEATQHPHSIERHVYTEIDGVVQPNPAPRFSRTPSEIKHAAPAMGADTRNVFLDWGFSESVVDHLEAKGFIAGQ